MIRNEAEDEEITYRRTPAFRVDVRLFPEAAKLPPELEARIAALVDEARAGAEAEILGAIETYQRGLDDETASLRGEKWTIAHLNAELIARNRANQEIEALIVDLNAQNDALGRIRTAKEALDQLEAQRAELAVTIADATETRTTAIDALEAAFRAKPRHLERMTFGLESQITDDAVKRVSEQLNKLEHGPYVTDRAADVAKAQSEPAAFLAAMESGAQKVLQNSTAESAAIDMLTVTPEIRFFAELEGDRIGGFKPSSMTPGKQAFFALSLILSQDQEDWPLLIDQPEDDLDSRSVYDVLVEYLKARKVERQIIMVSHNANLVVGADTEQVLVANRHGSDRRNDNDRMFDYLCGSLEHSRPRSRHRLVLMECGIREHACGVLDGGEEAFLKRQQKYRLT